MMIVGEHESVPGKRRRSSKGESTNPSPPASPSGSPAPQQTIVEDPRDAWFPSGHGTPTGEPSIVVKVDSSGGHAVLTLFDGVECTDPGQRCLITFDTVTGLIVRGVAAYAGALAPCPSAWPTEQASEAKSDAPPFFVQPPTAANCPQALAAGRNHGVAVGTVGWLVDASPRGPYFESVDGEQVGPTAPPSDVRTGPDTSFPSGGVPTAEAVVVVRVDAAHSAHPVLTLYDATRCPPAAQVPPTPNVSADFTRTTCLLEFDTATGKFSDAGMYDGAVGGCSNLPARQQDVSTPFFVDPEPTDGCPQLPYRHGLSAGSVGWLLTASPDAFRGQRRLAPHCIPRRPLLRDDRRRPVRSAALKPASIA